MNANLARILVQRGVIRQGTVVEAYQSAKGLSCLCDSYALTSYVVIGATASSDHVYFDVLVSQTDRQRLRNDYIASIDGMAVKRVAAAHQLQEDGHPIAASRRGRKRP